jgi:uncharacterized FlgJ-related protein
MKQTINLKNQIFRIQRVFFPLRVILWMLFMLIILILVMNTVEKYKLEKTNDKIKISKMIEKKINDRIQILGEQIKLSSVKRDSAHEEEEERFVNYLQEYMENKKTKQLSTTMNLFSKDLVKGAWITSIRLNLGKSEAVVKGETYNSMYVLRYMEALNREKVFNEKKLYVELLTQDRKRKTMQYTISNKGM